MAGNFFKIEGKINIKKNAGKAKKKKKCGKREVLKWWEIFLKNFKKKVQKCGGKIRKKIRIKKMAGNEKKIRKCKPKKKNWRKKYRLGKKNK